MQIKKIFAFVVLLMWIINPTFSEEANRLRFGVTPWKSPEELQKGYAPLMKHLHQAIAKEVVLFVAKDYKELAERVQAKSVDIGLFSPNAYVQAKRENPQLQYLATALNLQASGEYLPYYFAEIYVMESSPFKTLQDLKGKRFGFIDVQSTSGYLLPNAFLRDQGIVPETFFKETFMLKKHDKIYSALVSASIDAGAAGEPSRIEAEKIHGKVFRKLVEVGKIPSDVIAAGSHLDKELGDKIKKIFIALNPQSPVIQEMSALGLHYKGYVDAGDALYDSLRKISP